VLDLGGQFVGDDFRVRLTTTAEIRWDAAWYSSGEEPAPTRVTSLRPQEAMLEERGYGAAYYEAPDGPVLFDYHRVRSADHAPGWDDIAGHYTRLGDCAPLLQASDNQYVIMAPGDAMRLLFDRRRLPPLRKGWKRDFIFRSDGWTKDADQNTVEGDTVEPLPFHGMTRYPPGPDERFPDTPAHRAWQREWNTRVKGTPPDVRRAQAGRPRGPD
jgi:hypothetical protein